jgi:hypothetical protein
MSRRTASIDRHALGPIEVALDGHHISLRGDYPTIARRLRTYRIESGRDQDHGYYVTRRLDSLLSPADGMRRPKAGLLPVIEHLAAIEGRRLDVYRVGECPTELPEAVYDPRIIDPGLIDIVRGARGVIRIGPSVRPIQVVAQIAAAYPTCRIVVMSDRTAQLARAYQALRQWLPDRHVLDHVPEDDEGAWIACSTFFDAAGGDLEKCHLLLLLDGTQAAHQRAEATLATMDARFHLFGLLRADRRLSPTEQDVMMATFGPQVLDLPAHGQEFASVSVTWLSIAAPVISADLETVDLYRAGYVNHPVRNRRLARLARALANRDEQHLRRHRHIVRWLADQPDRPLYVTVLVQSVEHAIALARDLPGWSIVAGAEPHGPVDTSGLRAWQRRLLDERRLLAEPRIAWGSDTSRQIVTAAAAPRRLTSADVVIWAGGGRGMAPIPPSWLRRPAGMSHRLLIVDCIDRHHARLAAWSQERHLQYVEAEMYDVGVDPFLGRMIWFLFTAPRGPLRRRRSNR